MNETFLKIKNKLVLDFYYQSCLASIGYIVLISALFFIPLIRTDSLGLPGYMILIDVIIGINLLKLVISLSKLNTNEEISDLHLKTHLSLAILNGIALAIFFTFCLFYVPTFQNEFWFIFFLINTINTASVFSVVVSPVTVFTFIGILGLLPPSVFFLNQYYITHSLSKNSFLILFFSVIYFVFLCLRARAHQKMILKLYKYEQEIANQTAITTEAMKLSAIGEMAGGIAHEINNPLAIIYLHTKKLSDFAEKKPQEKIPDLHKRYFKILQSIKRIEKVLNGLKTYSQTNRADRSLYQRVDIEDPIEVAKSLSQSKLVDKNITLTIEYLHNHAKIFANKSELSQVILHLINNSIEALENQVNGTIILRTFVDYGNLCILVSDNGPGVSKEILEKIFIPFFSTKNLQQHHGIGLSTSHAIIDAHNGDIKVDPDIKIGFTNFLVKIPLISEPSTR